eukprot:414817_1
MTDTTTNTTCLTSSTYTCGQIFTITINSSETICDVNNGDIIDLTGDYTMSFTPSCRSPEADACTTYINALTSPTIALSVNSNFIDTTCKPELYSTILNGAITFYDDDQFTIVHDANNGDYVIGQDTIYISAEITIPDDGSLENYNIFDVEIDNVFVCTTENDISLDSQTGYGGCISGINIDNTVHYIFINGDVPVGFDYRAELIDNGNTQSNVVKFKFLAFDIGREIMYIHIQLNLKLQTG